MMSEISYHQQQYIRHQKREKKLVLCGYLFFFSFWCCGKSPPGPG